MIALPPATTSPKEVMENWLPKAIAEAGVPENAKTVEVRLGIRLESVYRLIYSGLLRGERVDGKWQIPEQSVEEYAAKHSRKGHAR